MKIKTTKISIQSKGSNDIINITDKINFIIKEERFHEGNVLIFVPGSTAGISTIEYEPGLLEDYPNFLEKIIPKGDYYKHNETWGDGNGFSHIRSTLQGTSLSVPFLNSNLLLGTWQQIIFIEFDNRPRKREIILQLIGV